MASELISLPSSVVATGPDASELIVAFRVAERMTGFAIGIEEADDEVVVRVEAAWSGLDASAGAFPHFTYTSTVVELERPLGSRRVRAVPDGRHAPGIC